MLTLREEKNGYFLEFMNRIHETQMTPSFYNYQLKFLIKPPHLKGVPHTLVSLESN